MYGMEECNQKRQWAIMDGMARSYEKATTCM